MDSRAEIREFLMSRRAKITPARAGLPPAGRRRVPGLRRIEVAMLAGVSVEYYSRLERGDAAGVSESILDAIAGALQLDDAERRHLLDLVRTSGATRAPRRRTPVPRVRPTVQYVLDAITGAPAIVHDGRLDHLGGNALGKALFSPFIASGDEQPNSARYTFLDPRAPEFLRDWDKAADDTVAILRAEAGRHPYDRNLSDLIGELSTRSEEFRTRWASHDVRIHATGTKRLHHPVVGDLDLSYESFPMPDHGQTCSCTSPSPAARPTTRSGCSPATRPPTTKSIRASTQGESRTFPPIVPNDERPGLKTARFWTWAAPTGGGDCEQGTGASGKAEHCAWSSPSTKVVGGHSLPD